jgi:hypothetical protein
VSHLKSFVAKPKSTSAEEIVYEHTGLGDEERHGAGKQHLRAKVTLILSHLRPD